MAGMEALGRLWNVVPIAAGVLIPVKDTSGITFVCTGADTFTVKSAATYNGTATALAAIGRYYENTATNGSALWTDSGDITPVSAVTIASGSLVFYVDESDLPAGAQYVEVAIGASGLVAALVGDLKVQRTPANLRLLSGASS
jgi:hypothetical protein